MTINIQFVRVDKNNFASALMEKKLEKLAEKFEWIIKAEVIFKEENDRKGKGSICEVTLSVPGPLIFAASKAENHEKALDQTINELKTQLNKRKAGMKAHV
ncbi:ribosome hibernation-promoting factor, HPF/YfiA family [Robertkochia solimangrovi]|uniref:ribosome hibernation-promoting factor, HPF/YfiA family n=1 Tax=Robertkochia solimangrovi TaxID=2213046 RepID=UPI00117E241C|nr:ribosome-associated translation inhibitor RaiA [Robertkochia solimangrovi]TRZ44318.1 ribosome-associated translation inhibitor RaiA [Robertkochia solimangrovi]